MNMLFWWLVSKVIDMGGACKILGKGGREPLELS